MIVANSSPIIIFAKQGLIDILKKCFQKVVIPESVYEEVMQKKNTPEAIALEKAIKDKWIIVENVIVSPMLKTQNLGQGEKEAISLAIKHKSILVIGDDSAKNYASIFGIEAHGTLYIVYLACRKKFIEKDEVIDILKVMIKNGFYVSIEVYNRFLELLETLR